MHALVIDFEALPAKQNVNPPVAVPNPHRCDVPDALAKHHRVLPNRAVQVPLAVTGAALLCLFLGVHVWKDVTADVAAWYLHSTPLWITVMVIATTIYFRELGSLRRLGVDTDELFRGLPPE